MIRRVLLVIDFAFIGLNQVLNFRSDILCLTISRNFDQMSAASWEILEPVSERLSNRSLWKFKSVNLNNWNCIILGSNSCVDLQFTLIVYYTKAESLPVLTKFSTHQTENKFLLIINLDAKPKSYSQTVLITFFVLFYYWCLEFNG